MFDPLPGRDPLRFYFRKRQPPASDYLLFVFLVVAYGRFDSNYFVIPHALAKSARLLAIRPHPRVPRAVSCPSPASTIVICTT